MSLLGLTHHSPCNLLTWPWRPNYRPPNSTLHIAGLVGFSVLFAPDVFAILLGLGAWLLDDWEGSALSRWSWDEAAVSFQTHACQCRGGGQIHSTALLGRRVYLLKGHKHTLRLLPSSEGLAPGTTRNSNSSFFFNVYAYIYILILFFSANRNLFALMWDSSLER